MSPTVRPGRRRVLRAGVGVALLGLALPSTASAAAAAAPEPVTTLVSGDRGGRRVEAPDGLAHVLSADVSADGRWVAFASSAALLPGVTGPAVYLRDRRTGALRVVSRRPVSVVAEELLRSSPAVTISGTGRYVVFDTDRPQLPGVPEGGDQAYVYDRVTGSLRLLGARDEPSGQGYSSVTFVGSTDRYALFRGSAVDAGTATARDGLHLYDIGRRRFAAVAPASALAGADVVLTPDQTALVVRSRTDLAKDGKGTGLFRRPVTSTRWTRLRALPGRFLPRSFEVGGPAGRYLVFGTDRALVRGDRNRVADVYRWDSRTGALGVVSVTNKGASCRPARGVGPLGQPGSTLADVSADARTVLFVSNCANLTNRPVAGDALNVFVRDTVRHTTRAIDVTPRGKLTSGLGLVDSEGILWAWPALSADGRWAVLIAGDRHLVGQTPPADRPDPTEAYVRGPLR